MRQGSPLGVWIAVAGAAGVALSGTPVQGQSLSRAIFVANNGNLEGSVTSMLVEPDGSLAFVQKVVTGSTPSSQEFDPGTNAYAISISDDGRFLAVGHATSSNTVEQITILEVASDATIGIVDVFTTPDSPLDVAWIGDRHLAVTQTKLSGPNNVIVYAYDPDAHALDQVDSDFAGAFCTWLERHPSGEWLFANDSGGNDIRTFAVNPDRTLTLVQTMDTGSTYPLGLGASPDGNLLYSGGGISSGGHAVSGFSFAAGSGPLNNLPTSPYESPGSSPKQVVVSSDNAYALVAHGTDATIRTFSITPRTGALTSTGQFFDVGFQGSLGEVAVMDDLVFATDRDTIIDGVRGVYSFTLAGDGALIQNGPLVDTQGIGPNSIAVWKPRSGNPADLNGDGLVDGADLGILLGAWGGSGPGDLNGDGTVDGADLGLLLAAWT
ncbi:MAG: beta-propeller fold lactonase family protein [Phycisphaerales bacterium]|nr:beta-propeller fold lactonase family protein [Phycisphaerales bacterium]